MQRRQDSVFIRSAVLSILEVLPFQAHNQSRFVGNESTLKVASFFYLVTFGFVNCGRSSESDEISEQRVFCEDSNNDSLQMIYQSLLEQHHFINAKLW